MVTTTEITSNIPWTAVMVPLRLTVCSIQNRATRIGETAQARITHSNARARMAPFFVSNHRTAISYVDGATHWYFGRS